MAMRMELGLRIECTDGPGGTLRDVVIDPVRRQLTHVVVERHHHHLAHLVPIEDVDRLAAGTALRLGCTVAQLERYPQVEETAYLRLGEWPPLEDEHWDVGVSSVLSAPLYDSPGYERGAYPPLPDDRLLIAYDRIPAHEVEIRRGSAVEAANGAVLGHVDSFLSDDEGRVTHLVLERGHLWRRRDITIPVDAVKQLRTDSVELSLTPDEVAALPSVPGHWHRPPSGG
ncbi:MAG: PRC-barrel domain-containing protein [Acidimicrobiales bacterium]